jgi:hypothetical protein
MKTAVDRIGSGKARQVNARFAAMASHADKFTKGDKNLTAPVRA